MKKGRGLIEREKEAKGGRKEKGVSLDLYALSELEGICIAYLVEEDDLDIESNHGRASARASREDSIELDP